MTLHGCARGVCDTVWVSKGCVCHCMAVQGVCVSHCMAVQEVCDTAWVCKGRCPSVTPIPHQHRTPQAPSSPPSPLLCCGSSKALPMSLLLSPHQPHQALAALPECPCQAVIAPRWPRQPGAGVGEVAATEGLKAVLCGTVQHHLCGLGRVQEQEPGQRQQQRLQPQRRVPEQRSVDEPCGRLARVGVPCGVSPCVSQGMGT